jgi:hypothetical protein
MDGCMVDDTCVSEVLNVVGVESIKNEYQPSGLVPILYVLRAGHSDAPIRRARAP